MEEHTQKCQKWMWPQQIIDVLLHYPIKISAQDIVEALEPLRPRFYSISSSLIFVSHQIHLIVSTLRYLYDREKRGGLCSTFLADRAKEIQSIPHFRLPEDQNIPVIMVGAGTDIAPFLCLRARTACVGS